MVYIQFLISLWIFIGFTHTSVIPVNDSEPAVGLYNASDRVFVLTVDNFDQTVYNQTHATEVEFYNSFCGFCRRFAPLYKEYAQNLYGWRNVLKVAAIDCAADDNSDLCRNFEIMSYPSLRYFPPFYENTTKNLGLHVEHAPMDVGHPNLVTLLLNTTKKPEQWPTFTPVQYQSRDELFNNLGLSTKFLFLLYDTSNGTTVAQEVALDFSGMPEIHVRQIASIPIAVGLGLTKQASLYVAQTDQRAIEMIKLNELQRADVQRAINDYLVSKGHKLPIVEQIPGPGADLSLSSTSERATGGDAPFQIDEEHSAIVEFVKANIGAVYQADLEEALKYSIFHEIIKYNSYTDEQRASLKHYVSVLKKYSPLGENGKRFLAELHQYVIETNRFTGKELDGTIKSLADKHKPIFSSQKGYIGCRGSMHGRRGYTCGLWTLFHFLTVQAASPDHNLTADPLEVLRSVHGFVKHFFGCSHCSQHFQEMAQLNNIWNVKSNAEAVLWLWSAHNQVNKRLAGDDTEDPAFPKIQFPSAKLCTSCHQVGASNDSSIQWNQDEVLNYLRRMNSPANISQYGVNSDNIRSDFPRAQGHTSTAFSEMDIRMGMLLYAFCMLIIIIAVKLFMRRGYRKKVYTHDFMGKI